MGGANTRRVRRQGPVTLRDKQIPATTTDQRLLDLAEPADKTGHGGPRNPVGEQEVKVFLLGQGGDQAADCHESVSR